MSSQLPGVRPATAVPGQQQLPVLHPLQPHRVVEAGVGRYPAPASRQRSGNVERSSVAELSNIGTREKEWDSVINRAKRDRLLPRAALIHFSAVHVRQLACPRGTCPARPAAAPGWPGPPPAGSGRGRGGGRSPAAARPPRPAAPRTAATTSRPGPPAARSSPLPSPAQMYWSV